jgi:hypothetical protein
MAGSSAGCRVPDSYLNFPIELDRTERSLVLKRPVRVFMLGAAMGEGPFLPLESELEERLPRVDFQLTQAASTGGAEEDFETLRTVISRTSPDLVIWQVGVSDAIAASDLADFEATLDGASDWIEKQGPDLILVDPPFVPHVKHERIYVPYVGEIGETSRTEKVPLLRRYATMQYLATGNAGAAATCVPEVLAEAIVRSLEK